MGPICGNRYRSTGLGIDKSVEFLKNIHLSDVWFYVIHMFLAILYLGKPYDLRATTSRLINS